MAGGAVCASSVDGPGTGGRAGESDEGQPPWRRPGRRRTFFFITSKLLSLRCHHPSSNKSIPQSPNRPEAIQHPPINNNPPCFPPCLGGWQVKLWPGWFSSPKIPVTCPWSKTPVGTADLSLHTFQAKRTAKLEVVNTSNRTASVQASVNSKFHLPELKVHHGQQQSVGTTENNLNSYDRQQQQPVDDAIARIDDAIAAAINGGSGAEESSSPRNGRQNFSSNSLLNNDEFVRRLVEAVKREPALYDPSHEHYGNKHASAQFRATIWLRLCKELDHPDPHSLQNQWKRIRDKYIRERRRKRGTGADLDSSSSARHYNAMRWMDDFLGLVETTHPIANTNGNGPTLHHLPSTSGEVYMDQQQQNHHLNVNGSVGSTTVHLKGRGHRMGHGHQQQKGLKKNESTNGSPSSTSSEISVGSAAAAFGQQQHSQQQAILLPQLRHLAHGNGTTFNNGPSSRQQVMYKLKDEEGQHLVQHDSAANNTNSVQMGADGAIASSSSSYQIISIPPSHSSSAQQMAMGLEPQGTQFFQPIQSTSSAPSSSHPPRRKRAALEPSAVQQMHTQSGRGQQQLVIEQDRIIQGPMVVHHPTTAVQESSPLQMHSNPVVGAAHGRVSTLRLAQFGRSGAGTLTEQPVATAAIQPSTSLLPQPHYILSTAQPQQQQHYDLESSMIELIVRHLGNLNDDEKVVTKMNIQRILMDARFGRGACVRMFREEEQQSELSMEQQQRQQHMQQHQNSVNSSRR